MEVQETDKKFAGLKQAYCKVHMISHLSSESAEPAYSKKASSESENQLSLHIIEELLYEVRSCVCEQPTVKNKHQEANQC